MELETIVSESQSFGGERSKKMITNLKKREITHMKKKRCPITLSILNQSRYIQLPLLTGQTAEIVILKDTILKHKTTGEIILGDVCKSNDRVFLVRIFYGKAGKSKFVPVDGARLLILMEHVDWKEYAKSLPYSIDIQPGGVMLGERSNVLLLNSLLNRSRAEESVHVT